MFKRWQVSWPRLTAPQRGNDGTSLGDEHALVHVVGRGCMRSAAKNGHRPPAKCFGDDSLHILQGRQIVKRRQPIATDNPIKLRLGLGDEAVAELDARKQEAGK